MGVFGSLFGGKTSAPPSESRVKAQLPAVEAAFGRCVVDFQDRTKIHYVLIFPIMHKIAVKLFVEDFGVEPVLKRYEDQVASLTTAIGMRESQFQGFGWPEVPLHEAPHAQELEALLWKLTRDLAGRGIFKETIANALVNVALNGSSKMDPLLCAGFLITVLKELRAGFHTPPAEVRPEATEGTDEPTPIIFNHLRDAAYLFKDHTHLEWQHLIPGMQRLCVICCIKCQGRDETLARLRAQVQHFATVLHQCQRKPPQQFPLPPVHKTNISTFKALLNFEWVKPRGG
jgi:hypothetical protein